MLVMVDCFSWWTEACPLPDKTAISVADAFFSNIVCRFGMPSVIHSDQGREFENKVMHEMCLLGGSHKTKTTPYHPESDGLVERFNRTLLMMLAMFAGEHKDDGRFASNGDDGLRVYTNQRVSAHTDSCLVKNVCCLGTLGYHAGNRTSWKTS